MNADDWPESLKEAQARHEASDAAHRATQRAEQERASAEYAHQQIAASRAILRGELSTGAVLLDDHNGERTPHQNEETA